MLGRRVGAFNRGRMCDPLMHTTGKVQFPFFNFNFHFSFSIVNFHSSTHAATPINHVYY